MPAIPPMRVPYGEKTSDAPVRMMYVEGSAIVIERRASILRHDLEAVSWQPPTLRPSPRSQRPRTRGCCCHRFSLWWREIVRFYRQRARVVGVIASPLLFWIVIGSGFGTSFRSNGAAGGQHYLDYFFPGALIMIVLFTAIFTMMSVIEDRKEGFLLSVLVAPVSRSVIVLGKVLGRRDAGNRSRAHLPGLRAGAGRAFHAAPVLD